MRLKNRQKNRQSEIRFGSATTPWDFVIVVMKLYLCLLQSQSVVTDTGGNVNFFLKLFRIMPLFQGWCGNLFIVLNNSRRPQAALVMWWNTILTSGRGGNSESLMFLNVAFRVTTFIIRFDTLLLRDEEPRWSASKLPLNPAALANDDMSSLHRYWHVFSLFGMIVAKRRKNSCSQ